MNIRSKTLNDDFDYVPELDKIPTLDDFKETNITNIEKKDESSSYSIIFILIILILLGFGIYFFLYRKKNVKNKNKIIKKQKVPKKIKKTLISNKKKHLDKLLSSDETSETPINESVIINMLDEMNDKNNDKKTKKKSVAKPTAKSVAKPTAKSVTKRKAKILASSLATAKKQCNYKEHCINKCKKSGNKFWCYLNKNSKNICRIDGNKKVRYANKRGSKWSYEPCKNFKNKPVKKIKKQKLKYCKCNAPWPCYNINNKKCMGSGNIKDFPNNDSINKYCNNLGNDFKACINNKIMSKNQYTLIKNNPKSNKKISSNCLKCQKQKCKDCISRWGYCGSSSAHCNGGIDCKKC